MNEGRRLRPQESGTYLEKCIRQLNSTESSKNQNLSPDDSSSLFSHGRKRGHSASTLSYHTSSKFTKSSSKWDQKEFDSTRFSHSATFSSSPAEKVRKNTQEIDPWVSSPQVNEQVSLNSSTTPLPHTHSPTVSTRRNGFHNGWHESASIPNDTQSTPKTFNDTYNHALNINKSVLKPDKFTLLNSSPHVNSVPSSLSNANEYDPFVGTSEFDQPTQAQESHLINQKVERTQKNANELPQIHSAKTLTKQSFSDKISSLRHHCRCLNCRRAKWKNKELQLCENCLSSCPRITCRHCEKDFMQHHYCLLGEQQYGRAICLSCILNMMQFNEEPKACHFCGCWAAWNYQNECDRCASRIQRYGLPKLCNVCGKQSAFEGSVESQKEGGANSQICYLCFCRKKKMQTSERTPTSKLKKGTDINGTPSLQPAASTVESNRDDCTFLQTKVKDLENQIVQKDVEFFTAKQKYDHELRRVTTDLEAQKEKTMSLIAEDRKLQRQIEYLRDRNQFYSDTAKSKQTYINELLACIDTLKSSNETLIQEKQKLLQDIKALQKHGNNKKL